VSGLYPTRCACEAEARMQLNLVLPNDHRIRRPDRKTLIFPVADCSLRKDPELTSLSLDQQFAETEPAWKTTKSNCSESYREDILPLKGISEGSQRRPIVLAPCFLRLRPVGKYPPSRTAPGTELAAAEKLAEWRAPSDVLLETPGQEILRTTPRLGESYLRVPVKTDQEE
jgi:hypothetical protein